MKILRTKQTIENKNVRHLKFVQYILTLCFLLFIVVGITGCTKEYTADDIKSYAKETLSIRRVTVGIIPHEYKDEDGYTDILWTVKDKKNNITFHVLDNTFYGVESVANMLLDDYDDSVFAAYADKLPTDILSYEITESDQTHLTNAEIVAEYTNKAELNACLSALQDVYTFYEEKGFDDLVIGYTLRYQPPENNMDAEPDTEEKEYTGILSDIPTISEFK